MAVAKCTRCSATATVRIVDGQVVLTSGDSFQENCRMRKSKDELSDLADCETMHEAVTVTANRLRAGLGSA